MFFFVVCVDSCVVFLLSLIASLTPRYASSVVINALCVASNALFCLLMKGMYWITVCPKSTIASTTPPTPLATEMNADAIKPNASINNPTVVPKNFPIEAIAASFSFTNAVSPLAAAVSSSLRPPSPSFIAVSAMASEKFEKAPLNVLALSSMAPSKSSAPIFSNRPSISSALLLSFIVVPLNCASSLSPWTLTLIPSCLSISNSPVVALNTALATSSNLLPIPAAMLPRLVIICCVGFNPAFLSVMKPSDTSANWNVVPAVNFLMRSNAVAAASVLP